MNILQSRYLTGINTISSYDVCETGVPDILLGRSDGVVEVYSMDENNQPQIQFTHVSTCARVCVCVCVCVCLCVCVCVCV